MGSGCSMLNSDILDSVYNIKLDLKKEPQIIDYYKNKSPVKSKDDKWEIIS